MLKQLLRSFLLELHRPIGGGAGAGGARTAGDVHGAHAAGWWLWLATVRAEAGSRPGAGPARGGTDCSGRRGRT
jgi:hypothetical protein